MRDKMRKVLILGIIWMTSLVSLSDLQGQGLEEEIYVHLNTNYLISGETLYYSLYCLDAQTGRKSDLSKYVYLQLVGQNGIVHKKKMKLEEGVTSGSFFVPTDLISGQYYLLAYTHWMKNFGTYSKSPIMLLNPYQALDQPLPAVSDSLQIEVASLTGEYISGEENTIAFRVSNVEGLQTLKVRLVDSQGQTKSNIVIDDQGIGRFKYTPVTNESYKLILNQSDELYFFDLPDSEIIEDYILLEGDNEFLNLKVRINGGGTIEIRDGSQVLTERIREELSSISVRRSKLSGGGLTLVLKNAAGLKVKTYQVYNQKISTVQTEMSFGKREKVDIPINLDPGRYSISVRKKYSVGPSRLNAKMSHLDLVEDFQIPNQLGYESFENISVLFAKEPQAIKTPIVEYLPEFRGELIEGHIISQDAKLEGKPVMLALPNAGYNLSANRISKDGTFLIEYNSMTGGPLDAHITVYDYSADYEVRYKDNFIKSFPGLKYKSLKVDSLAALEIKERSIASQIREAYLDSKSVKRTISSVAPPIITTPSFNYSYDFDNYTRFKTLSEHFLEYIALAKVRKNDAQPFELLPIHLELDFLREPLITLDGVPVNGKDLLSFSPFKIKTLNVLNTTFYLQTFVADGVLDFRTFDGDMMGFSNLRNSAKFSLEGAFEPEFSELSPEEINDELIPDQRIQLLWIPKMKVEEKRERMISFITSDVEGEYELVIEGWTDDGSPMTIINLFKVSNNEN